MDGLGKLRRIHLARYSKRHAGDDEGSFASIAKPYEQFYEEKVAWVGAPCKTIYQAVFDNNKDFLEGTALIYGDASVSFGAFFAQIDRIARSLCVLGVGRDDVVSAAMVSTPEAVCLLYATSKVGATFACMDPRDSINELKAKLEQAAPKCLFVSTGFEKVAEAACGGLAEVVVSLSPDYSPDRFNAVITYDDFLRSGEDAGECEVASWRADHVAAIVYTGASTGAAKGVKLSDFSFNAMAVAWVNSGYAFARGKRLLDVLPLFIAYGVCNAIHVPLMWGETIVLVNPFRMDCFADFLLDFKPQHVYAGPPHMRFLRQSKRAEDADFSFLELVASGGAGMPVVEDLANYQFFAQHGAEGVYGQGYGMSEINAAFCYGNGRKNRVGFIGVPLADNDAVIVDEESFYELPFGQEAQGLLMVRTPTVMLGYHGAAAARNEEVFVVDDANEIWVSTGDVCTMDLEGRIKIIDRAGRGFNMFGMNMYPSVIEDVIGTHPLVRESVVVGLPHERMGSASVANIVVEADQLSCVDRLADELDALIANELPSYTKIYAYRFRVEMPYTSRGKPNYQLIQSQGVDDLGEEVLVVREIADIEAVLGVR